MSKFNINDVCLTCNVTNPAHDGEPVIILSEPVFNTIVQENVYMVYLPNLDKAVVAIESQLIQTNV